MPDIMKALFLGSENIPRVAHDFDEACIRDTGEDSIDMVDVGGRLLQPARAAGAPSHFVKYQTEKGSQVPALCGLGPDALNEFIRLWIRFAHPYTAIP